MPETIHSGHFMASKVHGSSSVARQNVLSSASDVEDEPDDDEDVDITPSNTEKPVTFYKFGPNTSRSIAIDSSLNKLCDCFKLAYNKISTPRWKMFKGLKLSWKDRIRLNNVIWRAWWLKFVLRDKCKFCSFSVPGKEDNNGRVQVALVEGMYWKRRLETVMAEYKKWRMFGSKRKRVPKESRREEQSIEEALVVPLPSPLSALSDDDVSNFFTDTLFSSLNQPYMFPNPKEMAQAGNADFIQPGLVQLQPSLEEIMACLDTCQTEYEPTIPTDIEKNNDLPSNLSYPSGSPWKSNFPGGLCGSFGSNSNLSSGDGNYGSLLEVQTLPHPSQGGGLKTPVVLRSPAPSTTSLSNYNNINNSGSTTIAGEASKRSSAHGKKFHVKVLLGNDGTDGATVTNSASGTPQIVISQGPQASFHNITTMVSAPITPSVQTLGPDGTTLGSFRPPVYAQPQPLARNVPLAEQRWIPVPSAPINTPFANSPSYYASTPTQSDPLVSRPHSVHRTGDGCVIQTKPGPFTNRVFLVPSSAKTKEVPSVKRTSSSLPSPNILPPLSVKLPQSEAGSDHDLTGMRKRAHSDGHIDPQERKRMVHVNSEQSRRCVLKDGFELLRSLVPKMHEQAKITNAAVLTTGAAHLKELLKKVKTQEAEIQEEQKKLNHLESKIKYLQGHLPASANATQNSGATFETRLNNFIRARSGEQWQYYLLSETLRPVLGSLESFEIRGQTKEEVLSSLNEWAANHATLKEIRPGASNLIVDLATKTNVLKNPESLKEAVKRLANDLGSGK